ncbi:hypothetical protein HDU96_010375 [Phlyctochytrium bullatum]|nr:hypothetical protein HDU96_010375 [Phlyctochytrium bullatum]
MSILNWLLGSRTTDVGSTSTSKGTETKVQIDASTRMLLSSLDVTLTPLVPIGLLIASSSCEPLDRLNLRTIRRLVLAGKGPVVVRGFTSGTGGKEGAGVLPREELTRKASEAGKVMEVSEVAERSEDNANNGKDKVIDEFRVLACLRGKGVKITFLSEASSTMYEHDWIPGDLIMTDTSAICCTRGDSNTVIVEVRVQDYVHPTFTFTERSRFPGMTDTELLNSNNRAPSTAAPFGASPPKTSDIIVAGAGVQGLIYAIHTRLTELEQRRNSAAPSPPPLSTITVLDKSPKPGYKIGESTLPHYSLWLQSMLGLRGEVLLRLFGLKDGLCFYFLYANDADAYTDFCSSGVPGRQLAGYQVERPVNELLLTMAAQELGVNVFHGHSIDVDASDVGGSDAAGNVQNTIVVTPPPTRPPNPTIPLNPTPPSEGTGKTSLHSRLLVDATGRFHRFASKSGTGSRIQRFPGWNADAVWGYFRLKPGAKPEAALRFYESPHTNHLCFPEGWGWVIRLPSWEGSPLGGMMDLIAHLLAHARRGTPADGIESSEELATMFGCKLTWVTSIGLALRNDVAYPPDLEGFGTCEAERKFNYIVSKHAKLSEFMENFELIENHYGPGTTWRIRKGLAYRSEEIAGQGWVAVGDATGFTNPYLSPGITAQMSTSVLAATITAASLLRGPSITPDWSAYTHHCRTFTPALWKMNLLHYACFRHPTLAQRVSTPWQFFASVGNPDWTLGRYFSDPAAMTPTRFAELAVHWGWGTRLPEWHAVADAVLARLGSGGPKGLDREDPVVAELVALAEDAFEAAVSTGRFGVRWDGLLRYFDRRMRFDAAKTGKDTFGVRCHGCGEWQARDAEWRTCMTCGARFGVGECDVEFYEDGTSMEEYSKKFASLALDR